MPSAFKGVERVFDLLERGIDVEHGQRREEPEASLVVAAPFPPRNRCRSAPCASPAPARLSNHRPGVEGTERMAVLIAALVHLFKRLCRRPRDLARIMRQLALILPVEPGLLVFRRDRNDGARRSDMTRAQPSVPSPPSPRLPDSVLFPRVGEGIDHRPGLIFRRRTGSPGGSVAELVEVVDRQVLELEEDEARLRPFAIRRRRRRGPSTVSKPCARM